MDLGTPYLMARQRMTERQDEAARRRLAAQGRPPRRPWIGWIAPFVGAARRRRRHPAAPAHPGSRVRLHPRVECG